MKLQLTDYMVKLKELIQRGLKFKDLNIKKEYDWMKNKFNQACDTNLIFINLKIN